MAVVHTVIAHQAHPTAQALHHTEALHHTAVHLLIVVPPALQVSAVVAVAVQVAVEAVANGKHCPLCLKSVLLRNATGKS